MRNLIDFYRNGVKGNLILNPLMYFLVYGVISFSMDLAVAGGFVMILFIVGYMNKKSFNILNMLPVRVRDIIASLYLSLYIVIGIGGGIGVVVSTIMGVDFVVSFIILCWMILMVNLLIPENFSRGMNSSISGWFMMMFTFYAMVSLGFVVAFKYTSFSSVLVENTFLAIGAGIGVCILSLLSSYGSSVSRIYG